MSADTAHQVVTLGALLREAHMTFRGGNIDDPGRIARLVVGAATGHSIEHMVAHPDTPLTSEQEARGRDFIERYQGGTPVARLSGVQSFYGRPFAVSDATLDPRADTETLIAFVLEAANHEGWRNEPFRLLDIGTGTGAIGLTLLAECPAATAVLSDISADALATAQANAVALGLSDRVTCVEADLTHEIDGPFHLIISNPPYIISKHIKMLGSEVRDFDPHLALDGGADGLGIYRRLANELSSQPGLIANGGWLVVEAGSGQAGDIETIFTSAFGTETVQRIEKRADLGGHIRSLGFAF